MLWKRIGVIAAAAIVIVVGTFLFLKFDPFKASAYDNTSNDLWPQRQVIKTIPDRQYKILHIMSYNSPWEWTDNQLGGFQNALQGLNVQYHVMQMDTKRKSDEAWKLEIAKEIRGAIDTSKPDLIFASDDNAQLYVTKYYVNSSIPIVFSAVNADPAIYGFTGSENVTGVLEKMHYAATFRLLRKLVPNVRKVVMITDTGAMWPALIAEMKQQQGEFSDIEILSFDVIPTFAEFKQKVLAYQNQVDALGFLGIFEFKDETGKNVSIEDVFRWLQANSSLPDFSFWEDRISKGTLCTVSVSAYEQGYQAGLYARGILVDGKSPSAFPMISTEKGIPLINLATAKRLNIKPSADILLTAKVIQDITLK
jgi:ABC-type uncharacterized transport system substrate-binding protein